MGSTARRTVVLLAALLASSAGCATMMRGTTTTVLIGSDAPQAEVVVDGELRGVTPLAATLDHTAPHHVVVRSGGRERVFHLESNIEAGWVVVDLFLTSLIGLTVDAATGAWRSLSQETVFARFGDAALVAPTFASEAQTFAPTLPTPATGPVAPWNDGR